MEITPKQQAKWPMGETLLIAVLLAMTGGMLDAIIYLLHGHVFANAMTGNVVLLGISAVNDEWLQVLRRLDPIIAFLAGIIAAKTLRGMPDSRAVAAGLLLEMVVLALLGALGASFPDFVFVPVVAFASAFQAANFRKVHHTSYNSTFVTGNLRDMAEGAFVFLRHKVPDAERAEAKDKAISLAIICVGFFVGVITGAWLAPRFLNRSLWLPLPLLGTATAILFSRKEPLSAS